MTPEQLQQHLRDQLATLPGLPAVRAAREAAITAFADSGYPTRRHEDWRYTDLTPIAEAELQVFPAAAGPLPAADTARLLAAAGLEPGAHALLFVDGQLAADHVSARLEDGVELLSLAESLDRHGPTATAGELGDQPLAALNIAFASQGARLSVGPGVQAAEPIHIVFANAATAQQAHQPQLLIDLQANAQAKIVIHYLGTAETASWTNVLTKTVLGRGARLTLHRLQDLGTQQLHTELLDATLAADAEFALTSLDIGGRLVRNDIRIELAEPGAQCDLAGLTLAAEGQHVDNHLRVDHVASETRSEQSFRNIVGDHGRAVFNGKVIVRKDTKGISANQSSDNLLLAATGEVDTKPELEIYADDVKCTHGATVGELDERQLFYLRSRGLGDAEARGLLILAFAHRILERIAMPARLNARVIGKLGLKLPEDPTWRPTS